MRKLSILLLAWGVLFVAALIWVSKVPAGGGLINRQKEPTYEIYCYEYSELVERVPRHLFSDPEIVMEVNIATPCQAIEEKAKGLALIEANKPKMVYFGSMQMTAYVATGNPCADGNYPVSGWTVACNDSRLWHRTIYIEGYGTRYVHDTGGMASNVIDIFVSSYDEAIQFGRRSADVYVVD